VADQRQPEDEFFDGISNRVVDLERLMLEASSFEFETRHPQALTIKIMQVEFGLDLSKPKDVELLHSAWYICMDLNYTFAMLKNVTQALALASAELAFRLAGVPWDDDIYQKFSIHRDPVYETMFDLLELYTSHRASTFAGALFSLDTIMAVRIALNERADLYGVQRYAYWNDGQGRIVTPPYVTESTVAVRRFILQPQEAEKELQTLDSFFLTKEELYGVDYDESDGWETDN
jgi:CTD kinase subunit beta